MTTPSDRDAARKFACQNRKARHDYQIDETYEAGIALTGTEVKSLRKGRGSLAESHAHIRGGEMFIVNFHIPPYEQGNIMNPDPVRERKLLLHRREIDKLTGAVNRKGYTLVPLSVYFRKGLAKMEIGLAKGKKAHDKREDIKKRDQERDMRRAMK